MNRFIISSHILKPALARLGLAVNQKSVVPALKNIMFKVGDKYAELIASDLELTILQRCECETTGEAFEMLLPFDIISEIVRLNPNSPLQLTREKKQVRIEVDKDVYEIKKLEDIAAFPQLPGMPQGGGITISQQHTDILKAALLSVGKDLNMPVFNHVLAEIRQEGTTIVSTDTNICFVYTIPNLVSPAADDLLLPARLIKSILNAGDMQLHWNDKFIVFTGKDSMLFYTRSELKFVDWRLIIPKDYPSNLSIHRTDLVNALEKCRLNPDELKTAKLSLCKQKIQFSTTAKELGLKVQVDVAAKYSGEVQHIIILSDKMQKLVQQVSYEELDIAIHHSDKAILVRSKEDEQYTGLIMPVADGKDH